MANKNYGMPGWDVITDSAAVMTKAAANALKPTQRNGINRSQQTLPVDHPDAQVGNIKVDGGANASYGDE